MKKYLYSLVMMFFMMQLAVAQTARLQVIHNAADIAADPVDVYLWNGTANSLVVKLDDFAFRAATPFVDVPAGDSLAVIVAGPASANEGDQVIAAIPVGGLMAGEKYVVFANGVVTPGSYAANPDARSTAFQLLVKAMAREQASNSSQVEFFALHGATDAPTVDIIARGVATLVDDAAYTDMTDYIGVPAASYILDITPGSDNSTIVASFEADLSGLTGGSAVVFASGFLNPAANQNGPAFGLYAALANGTVVPFPAITTARLQVIHNAADIAADPVDVYLWNGTANSLVVKLDDFTFRAATPFVDVPAGDSLAVIVAGPASANEGDQVIAAIPVGGLMAGEKYVVFANGVVTPGSYAANPDARSTAFQLLVKAMAREQASNSSQVEFFALHGATDAPTVDIIARGVATLVDDAAYTDMTDYIAVPPASYTLDITPGSDNNTIVASFEADLSGLTGGSAVVFASGFLNPAANQNGPAFGLYAVLVDGTVITLPAVTSIENIDNQFIPSIYSLEQNYPNPFNPSTKIRFSIPESGNITLKVYDLTGREVATLVNGQVAAGQYEFSFSAAELASGVYFYKLTSGGFTSIKRMMLVR